MNRDLTSVERARQSVTRIPHCLDAKRWNELRALYAEEVETLRQLQAELKPKNLTLYPGHGEPAAADGLVAAQIEYIERFRELIIENRLGDGTVDDLGKQQIASALEAEFPDTPQVAAKFDAFLDACIDAVARELATSSG